MSTKVFANGRGISSEDSGGQSVVFPDVCKTPSPAGPVPLPGWATRSFTTRRTSWAEAHPDESTSTYARFASTDTRRPSGSTYADSRPPYTQPESRPRACGCR
jgi:hypothetical protein